MHCGRTQPRTNSPGTKQWRPGDLILWDNRGHAILTDADEIANVLPTIEAAIAKRAQ
jgi:hypothetical protein